MNLNQLYYFKIVAQVEHFRYAADLLNISQPSLSYAISSLENELGVHLFEKQGRNVSLTKYGKLFLDYVTTALDTLDEGKKHLQSFASSHSGHIDIAYIAPLSYRYVPEVVREFLNQPSYKQHHITFTFKQALTPSIIEGIKSGKYDVGFCSYTENEPLIHFEPIFEQELVAIVPLSHELAHLEHIELRQLEPYPFVTYAKESGLGRLTRKLFKEANLEPHIICEGEDETALLGLVAQNFGVSIIAKTEAIDHIPVKVLSLNQSAYKRIIYLAYMKNRFLTPVTKEFIDYVKTYIKS